MLGPVMTCMRVLGPSAVSLAMKPPAAPRALPAPWVSASRASTTGWRPRVMSMQGSFTNCGAHQFRVSERSARAHSASSVASARASRVSAPMWGCSCVQHLLVQPFFAGQGALLGAQGLVFKGLEFGGDEALGVLEGLAAAVVVGHLVGLALRDLNVEAVHLVELHAQVGDAGAGAFAHFEVEQKAVAVVLDGAQFVELGIEAGGDHAAFAHQAGGLAVNGAGQQGGATGGGLQIGRNISQKCRLPPPIGHSLL